MASVPATPRRALFRPQRGWIHGAALLAYLLLTLVMTWPLAAQFTTAIPGDSFDGWQNYWNLWWMKIALIERMQNPYITDLLYYPTGVTLYFHTLNPFNGLVTLPIQLNAGLMIAYNSVVLLSWVLAAYGTFLLAKWVLARPFLREPRDDSASSWRADGAAFVAGAIFTFAPVHMAHLLGHMQVMALQWLPFYVLSLLRGMARARTGRSWLHNGLLAGLFLTLAGLCDWYFVLYLFLFTGVTIGWAWLSALLQRRWQWQVALRELGPALVAAVLFALLLAPVLAPMIYEATRYSFMVRPASDLYTFSATVVDFLIPNRLHTLLRPEGFAAWGNQVAPVSERTISVGYAALGLAMVALVTRRRQTTLWAVAALFFVLLALGPRPHWLAITWDDIPADATAVQEWSPYALVNRLAPFMRISRSVSRFAIMVQLCVSVLAAIGLAWWMRRQGTPAARTLAVGVLAVVLAESWVAPYPMSPPDTPAYYATLAQQPANGAVLNLPMNYDRPGYLLYQTVHRRPLSVAYISRDDPRTLTERAPLLQHWRHLGPDILAVDPAQVGMTVLHDLGVEVVVLDRYKMPGGEEREYTEALAQALFAGSQAAFADERITVYRVTPPAQAQPYLMLGPLHWGPLTAEGDLRYRSIGDGPADLLLRHADRGAAVVIEYRSRADAVVSSADGNSWKLAAAPQGATMTVELPPGVDRLTFVAVPDQLWLTRLELLPAN